MTATVLLKQPARGMDERGRLIHGPRRWEREHWKVSRWPKVVYLTLDDALAASSRQPEKRLEAYRCRVCDSYHLGNPPRWTRQLNECELVELGPRVVACLDGENRGGHGMRQRRIGQRLVAVAKRRARSAS